MSTDESDEWCFSLQGYPEQLYGPYDSREEAIKDATEECECHPLPTKVQLGKVKWISPKNYTGIDIDELLESMDQKAMDDNRDLYRGSSGDSQFFDIRGKQKIQAQNELFELLERWSGKWVYERQWTMDLVEVIEIKGYMNECKVFC